MPIKIYGHDFKFMDIDGAACRFGLKDATGSVRAIFDGGQQSMHPTSSLFLQLISKDDDTNTNEPPSVRTRIGIQNISSCQHCLSFDSACLGVGSGSFGGLGQSHSAALTRRSLGSGN